MKQIEADYLEQNDKIKSFSITLGASPVRYYLASSSVGPKANFSNVLIETHDPKDAKEEENKFYEYMVNHYPDILTRSALFALSPVPDRLHRRQCRYVGPPGGTGQTDCPPSC